jgi:hypothetical protein
VDGGEVSPASGESDIDENLDGVFRPQRKQYNPEDTEESSDDEPLVKRNKKQLRRKKQEKSSSSEESSGEISELEERPAKMNRIISDSEDEGRKNEETPTLSSSTVSKEKMDILVLDKQNRPHHVMPSFGKVYQFFSSCEASPSTIAEHVNHLVVVRNLERRRTGKNKKIVVILVDQGSGTNA